MTAVGKVQARGQVTLPQEIRQAVDIHPGDRILFTPTGPSTIEMTVLPRMTLAEIIERFHVDEPLDMKALREAAYDDAALEVFGIRDES